MKQLELDLGLPVITRQLSHKGWTVRFYSVEGEIVYDLTNPVGRWIGENYTALTPDCLELAERYAIENINNMEASPPFVMSPRRNNGRS